MAVPPAPDGFLTVREFAAAARISPATVERLIGSGAVQALRIGFGPGLYRIPGAEARRLLAGAPYVTADEAAAAARISRMTVHRLIRSGELGSVLFGSRCRRIPEAEARRFLAAAPAAGQPRP